MTGTDGGIASANRNVILALQKLGQELNLPVKSLVLMESFDGSSDSRSFKGNKYYFAAATLHALLNSSLVVFDHVHLAVPIVGIPSALRSNVVILGHGSEVGRRIRRSARRTLAVADLVLANSEHTLNIMREALRNEDIGVVCPLGLPAHRSLSSEPRIVDMAMKPYQGVVLQSADGIFRQIGTRVMLIVGRLDAGEQEKGHRELIEALPAIRLQVPSAELVIVGGGSDEAELRRIAAHSPVANGIFVTGRVSDTMLDELYNAAYAYVMPSRQEGFGLVYLEAMNRALPCIACRNDGGGEIVVHNETGYLIDQPILLPNLVDTLVRLLSDPTLASRMGIAGWHRLRQQYTAEAHQARMVKLLRPLIANGSR